VATSGQALQKGMGWRKALRAASADNPLCPGRKVRETSSGGYRATVQASFSTYPPDRWVAVDLPSRPPLVHQRVLARDARNVRIIAAPEW
jgi:hypothetical protein